MNEEFVPFPITLESLEDGPKEISIRVSNFWRSVEVVRAVIISSIMTASEYFDDDPSFVLDVEHLETNETSMRFRVTKRVNKMKVFSQIELKLFDFNQRMKACCILHSFMLSDRLSQGC